jgi:phage terminase large subunit-like protein
MAAKGCVVTRGSTCANPHLLKAFIETVEGLYVGTRLGGHELEGELLLDIAGARWRVAWLELCRIEINGDSPYLIWRTVIGVGPPSGDGTCGIDAGGIGHALADRSVTARSPEGWARAVAAASQVHDAQKVVAETNQGGAVVEAVLRRGGYEDPSTGLGGRSPDRADAMVLGLSELMLRRG